MILYMLFFTYSWPVTFIESWLVLFVLPPKHWGRTTFNILASINIKDISILLPFLLKHVKICLWPLCSLGWTNPPVRVSTYQILPHPSTLCMQLEIWQAFPNRCGIHYALEVLISCHQVERHDKALFNLTIIDYPRWITRLCVEMKN